jgi:MoaA/NifB/PqqE/SkfB family radical SAM enzyme
MTPLASAPPQPTATHDDLPAKQRHGLGMEIARYLGKLATGQRFTPPFVTFFITNKCDCRCEHCFFWEDLNTNNDKELKLEQIQEMSRHMDDVIYLLIGGGEPYLRKDLADIIETFYKNNNLHSLVIPTNAQWTDRVVETVDRVMTNCPDLQFSTTISLDAIGDLYDKIRGKKNAYERAMATHEALKPLRKKHDKFSVRMCQTVMQQNQDVALETYAYQKTYLKPDILNVLYCRGNPLVETSKDFDMEAYRAVKERMADDMRTGAWVNHKRSDRGRQVLNALDDVVHDLIYRTEKHQKAQLTCQAGRISCVIYADGSLTECETKNTPYGNLKDVDMDFRRLWFTERGREIRKNVVNGCFCTHESSCFYPSLFFDVKRFPLMLRETVKHQLYDWLQSSSKYDKIEAATPAQQAPGYEDYLQGLSYSVAQKKSPAPAAATTATPDEPTNNSSDDTAQRVKSLAMAGLAPTLATALAGGMRAASGCGSAAVATEG